MRERKLLIVDDELYMTQVLASSFRRLGDCVTVASDGEEAFALACAHPPDLIITDLKMPLLSGLEMSVRLKENPQTAQIPVLLLTARGHRVAASELTRTNIRHLLPKPFSVSELKLRVEELIGPPARPASARPAALTGALPG